MNLGAKIGKKDYRLPMTDDGLSVTYVLTSLIRNP